MVLIDCRCRKTEDEVKLMKYVAKITAEGYKFMIPQVKAGIYERDMELYYMNYLRKKYYTRFVGYNAICGSGPNTAIMHYDLNNRKMLDGELLLIDMGIRFCGYCSDVTITIPVNGTFTEKQKKIYDIVLEANRVGIQSYIPGVTKFAEKDNPSFKVLLKGLQNIGILKKDFTVDRMFNDKIHRIFTPHGLGHELGVDVHDVGRDGVSYKSLKILEVGNIITMEPGIYFIPFLMDKAKVDPIQSKYINFDEFETYRDFGGVRIEDDVLLTEQGPVSLNMDIPRTTEEIEAFIANNRPQN